MAAVFVRFQFKGSEKEIVLFTDRKVVLDKVQIEI